MVSNSLEVELQELLDTLERLHRRYGADADYLALRRELPAEWPM